MAITRGTVQATTSGTEFDFTGIPSGVNRITVILDQVSLSGTDSLLIQIGDSGGIEATGYVSASSMINGTNTCAVTGSTVGYIIRGTVATLQISGMAILARITGNVWIAQGVFASSVGGSDRTLHTAGTKTLSAELDRVSITRSGTDTFDNGQVNIFYE